MFLSYNGVMPSIGKNVYIAPTAVVIGNVAIGDGVNIWFNAVIRGDMEYIKIGSNTNIQDNCTVHTDYNYPVTIGDNVTVGHNTIIHGCSIEKNVLVGMGSTILNGAMIKKSSIIAAGSTVLERQSIGPNQLVAGIPARHKKYLPSNVNLLLNKAVQDYLNLSKKYRENSEMED